MPNKTFDFQNYYNIVRESNFSKHLNTILENTILKTLIKHIVSLISILLPGHSVSCLNFVSQLPFFSLSFS